MTNLFFVLCIFLQSVLSDTLLANKARWHGRTIQDTTGGVSFSWEGTECTFQFSGATCLLQQPLSTITNETVI